MTQMSMRFYFEGTLSREISASAWLATLLLHDTFRTRFLGLIRLDGDAAKSTEWSVGVERDRHDIDLCHEQLKHVVIIENKIKSAAIGRGQLLRYIERQRQKRRAWRKTVVFLTPRVGVGEVEIDRLHAALGTDAPEVRHIDWAQVGELVRNTQWDESSRWFAQSGLDAIEGVIKRARQDKWPLTHGREVVHAIIMKVRDTLENDAPASRWRIWPGRDRHRVTNGKSPYTICADITFKADSTTRQPLALIDDKGIHATLEIRVHQSKLGRSDPDSRRKWEDLLREGSMQVEGLGCVSKDPSAPRWMYCRANIDPRSTHEEIATRLTAMTRAALGWTQTL